MSTIVDASDVNNALNKVNNALNNIDAKVTEVYREVGAVDYRVTTVESNLDGLINEFLDFVKVSEGRFNVSDAKQNLIRINQELDKLFGHYDEIRRMTTGILQANDLGIIRTDTMVSLTEEVTIKAPGYWLAPSLLALTAWINNDRETAEKALKEALNRDDEKTSLLFALICRRAGRTGSSMKWLSRFMEYQNPEKISHKAVVMLDAYVSGLLGFDGENAVGTKLSEWIEYISAGTNYGEKQIELWKDAMESLMYGADTSEWQFLQNYSKEWPEIESSLNYVELHEYLNDFFTSVYDANPSNNSLKVQLDGELNDLVTKYDQEEMELRMEKRLNELVVECDGDKDRAKKQMDVEKETFEEYSDFATLLTEAAMNPEPRGISPGLQKYAVAVSKDWILSAYRDVMAKYRGVVPEDITMDMKVSVNGHSRVFNGSTKDGSNEEEMIKSYHAFMESVKSEELSLVKHGIGEYGLMGVGGLLAVVGLCYIPWGILLTLAGAYLAYKGYKKYSSLDSRRKDVESQCERIFKDGSAAIRGFFSEVVDFRRLFKKKDAKSDSVVKFLQGLDTSHYLVKLSEGTRRIESRGE